jgi:AcrR family transcriptional regulator
MRLVESSMTGASCQDEPSRLGYPAAQMSPPDASRRSDRARMAILGATAELIAEAGYPKLSMEAIASRAGVGKQTIYRWWPSKGAVVFDAFMKLQEDAGGTELPETDDLAADITLLLRETVRGLVDPRFDEPYRALTTEIQHDPALGRELLDRLLGPLLAVTRQRIVRGQEAGQIDGAIDPGIAAELLFGPVFHRWLLRTAPLDDAYADALAEHLLRLLRPVGDDAR